MTVFQTRVLDASALVRMFDGHPRMLELLLDAEAGNVFLLLPAAAIAQAQQVLQAGQALWDPFLLFTGVRSLALTEHVAIEAGVMPGHIATTQVVHEARAVNGVVVTAMPDEYRAHGVSLTVI